MKDIKEHLWRWLEANARGKKNAVLQSELAGRFNVSRRAVRKLTERLTIEDGRPIATTVHLPFGVYVAITPGEKEDYIAQLDARMKALYRRRRAFSRIPLRKVIEQMELDYA